MLGQGLTDLIITGGLFVIAITVFLECGFIFGFFLPGDTLLFLAGFIAGQGKHNIVATILAIFAAAVLGNVTGYLTGNRAGPKVFTKEDGILFRRSYILQSQQFYEKHGGKTLILARFIPFVRTFAPLVAGIADMPFARFFTYSTIGAAFWAPLVTLIGFWAYKVIGHSIDIDKYILPIVGGVMVLSIGGSMLHAYREARKHRKRVAISELKKNQTAVEKQID